MINKRIAVMLMTLALSITVNAFAEDVHALKKIPFHEGDQLTLSLSNIDVNRLFVSDDLISVLSCPSHVCVTHQDKTGSAYITLSTGTTFTLFGVTESGRHFSVLVSPQGEPGFTYELMPLDQNKKAVLWEEGGPYAERLVDLIKSMMRSVTPEGYGRQVIANADKSSFNHAASMTLIERYEGEHFVGLVYEIHNELGKELILTPNGFYENHIKAIALSKQLLAKGESGFLYEVIAKDVIDANT